MIPKFLAALRAAALLLLASVAAAQQPSFDLVVRSPNDDVRELLERHLELRRYREVSDLDDSEMARLITLAERQARELVATQGYFTPEVRITREPGPRPQLVVVVEPGPATNVAAVDIGFEGDIASSTDPDAMAQREEIRSGWALRPGQRFTEAAWTSAKAQSTRLLLARRYPAGRISYSLADIDGATQEARLGLRLDSGALFRLGEMKVTGMELYDPVIVPRIARLPRGMVYDQDKIVEAQLRLAASGYFASAFLFVDPDSDPGAAPVQVTVREAPVQRLVLGLGFTTDGGPRATVEHTHNRVPGIGWRAVTKLQAEKRNPYAQTEAMSIPGEDGWRWAVQGRADRLDDGRLFTRSQRLRAGRLRSDDNIDRNMYLQYERSSVENPRNVALTPVDLGDGAAVSANYVWTGRYFDDPRSPVSGFGVGFELGGGMTLEGDRKFFQRSVLRGLWLRPLERGRIQVRGEAGAVLAQDDAKLPATQLFRTGGDSTVRGYRFLDIGVPLAGGYVGPGRYLTVASVEWQRPIMRDGRASEFEHTLFLDGGAVADRVGDLHPHWGVGTGVRWRSPVGPVDAALAYGIKARKLRVHITAGFSF